MDKNEIDFIERFLTRASIHKQWQYARTFVETYGDRIYEINRTYLINHVMRLSADEPIYLANHASAAAMAARTVGLGVGDEWLGCEPLYAGKMNFAIIKHDLWDAKTSKKTSVVEKIFHAKNRGGFIHETTLLALMPSEALRTPRYLGSAIVEPFYFEYAVFAEGNTPTPDEFERKFHHRALRFLWGSTPTQALLEAVKPKPAKALNWDRVQECIATAQMAVPGALAPLPQNRLEAQLRKAVETYQASPDTVFHDDLHRGNVITKGDDFLIIDWDKWIYEKPGAGAVYKGPEDPDALKSFLESAYCRGIKISFRDFRSNYLLFNLVDALRREEPSRVKFFAGLIGEID